jgi:PAS domain S-box-containing protein
MIPTMASAGQQPESVNIQLLVDSIPALIHTARPDGYLDYFNKPWLEYFGVTLDKVAGWNWTVYIHPEDVEGIVSRWRACLATGEIFEYETRVLAADGEYRWMFHRKVPLRDANGNIVKWYGSSLDIEDRKRAEALLSAEKRLLEMTATDVTLERILNALCLFIEEQRSGTLASVLLLDPDGVYLRFAAGPSIPDEWKQQMERLPIGPCAGSCGTAAYTRSPVIVSDIATDPLWEVPEHRASALKHGLRASWSSPVLSSKGKVLGTFCMYYREQRSPKAQDLELIESATRIVEVAIERDRTEQALRQSEAYLTEAQRLSHTGSFGWRPDTGEIVWSGETYRIFEYDPAEKPTLSMLLQRIHPQDKALVQQVIEGASRSTGFEHEYRLLLPDGRVKHVHAIAHAAQNASGDREFIGAVTDNTERKAAEEALRSSEAYLAEAQKMSQTGSWAWSPATGGPSYWSEECYRVLSFDPQDGLPRGEDFFQRIHPDDRPGFRELTETAIREKAEFDADYRVVHPDGRVRNIHVVAHPVLTASGELVEFVGTVIDVTERKRAEEELRRSEMELRRIVDLVPQLIAVYGPNRERLYANRTALDYLGISLDEWRHKSFAASAHPDDSERLKTYTDRALSSGAADELELRLRKCDGSYRWFLAHFKPLLDEQGHVVRWYYTGTDIDDRKQAEDKLRQENAALKRAEEQIRGQEAELRQLLDLVPQLVAVFGPDHERIYANQMGLDYLGVTLEEWRQTDDMRRFVHPGDGDRMRGLFERAVSIGTTYQSEFRIRKADGSCRWFLARYNPLRDELGRVARWYVALTDIEDRKQAEEKLRRSEDELRQLIDVIPQQVFVFGADWSPLFANRRELDYTGLTPEEAHSRDAVARSFHPEDLEKLEGLRERASQQNAAFEMEARIKGQDGEYRWFLIRDSPLRDEQGRAIRWYGTRTDIEQRKQAEEQLRQAHAELARVTRVVTMGELVASIAHEVNQPISGMVMNGNACLRWLAADSPNLDEARENARRIVRDGKRAGDVIARVRALATKTATAKVRLDMNELTREVIALAQSEAHRNGVTLRTELASDLSPVLGDRVELQQVILNLAMNAIEAMRTVEGRPRDLVIRTQNDHADQVRVTVQDSGIGLDSKSMERIFEAFYTTKHGGMGLGLSISRSIVEHHGGRLWAVTNDGPGTTFQFTVSKYH